MILPIWFDHLKESFSHKEVQKVLPACETGTTYPPTENLTGTPEHLWQLFVI